MSECTADIPETCKLSASDLAKSYESGDLSPVEVVKTHLTRAHSVNGKLNAFSVIDDEVAIAAAKASEERWRAGQPLSPIDGIPTTIKDILRCGMDARYGSEVTQSVSHLPDAPSVKLLRASGAAFIGLTNMPEFGWKAVTDNPKNGITLNPWDLSLTPGGSSGGASAAAASGAGTLHIGTDGGGSIRIPASFTGIVGHKPTFGRVPAYPASAFGTVAHIGPMARSVGDVSLMLNSMSGLDLQDWNQGVATVPQVDPKPLDWKGLRVGFWREPAIGENAPEVIASVESTVSDLQGAGALIEEFELPERDGLLEAFYRHWYVGAANVLSSIPPSEHHLMDPGLVEIAETGRKYTAVERLQAEITRANFGARMDSLLDEFDLVISPTVPVLPFEAGHNVPPGSGYRNWIEWSGYSFPINLSQQPACSVPCGWSAGGQPIGLQMLGGRGQDEAVLSAALSYERMYPERFLIGSAHWPDL